MNNQVCITIDTDWAVDDILRDTLVLVEKVGLPVTFFATNESAVLASLKQSHYEIGLHPNFFGASTDDELLNAISKLQKLYPEAIGARSHGLFVSYKILQLYKNIGMRYESNNFLYMHPYLRPTERFKELESIPFMWSDDKAIELETFESFDFTTPGLKVYNFHPIHIYLNTPNVAYYEKCKPYYHDPVSLEALRYKGHGVREHFIRFLEELALDNRDKVRLMRDLLRA